MRQEGNRQGTTTKRMRGDTAVEKNQDTTKTGWNQIKPKWHQGWLGH